MNSTTSLIARQLSLSMYKGKGKIVKKIVIISTMLLLITLTGCSNKQKEKVIESNLGDAKVTESAVDEDAVITINGKNARDTIHHIHTFYNGTICYGGYKDVSEKDQLEMARKIRKYIGEFNTENENLQDDLDKINSIATNIIKRGTSNSKSAYIALHKMFHDLDIYINDYEEEPFNVTNYGGK